MTRITEDEMLFNPAFSCAALIAAARGYLDASESAMPFPLGFMILPMVAQNVVRDALPGNTSTSMAAWLQSNPQCTIGFHARTMAFKPLTSAALRFGLFHDWLQVGPGGAIRTPRSSGQVEVMIQKSAEDVRKTLQRARFVGKWFAFSGQPSSVMALWGLKP